MKRTGILVIVSVLLVASSAWADTSTVYADDVVAVPERNGGDMLGEAGTWSDEANGTGVPDGNFATVTGPTLLSGQWLQYRLGFSVPDTGFRTGTVNSIQVAVTYRTTETLPFYFVLALEADNGTQPEANLATLGAYGFGNGADTPLAHNGFPFTTSSGNTVTMTITPANTNTTTPLEALIGDAAGSNGLMTGSIWAVDWNKSFSTTWNLEIDAIAVTVDYTPDTGGEGEGEGEEGEGEGEGELRIVSATMLPSSLGIEWGGNVTFAIEVAGGVDPITYKWFKNDDEISGATAATYTLDLVTGTTEAGSGIADILDAQSTVRWVTSGAIDNAGFTNPGNAEGVPDGAFAVATTPAAYGPTAAYFLGFTALTGLEPDAVKAINTLTIRVTYRSNSTKPLWAFASFVATTGSLPDTNVQGLASTIYALPLSSFPLTDLSGNTTTVDLVFPTEDLVIAPDLTGFFSNGITEGMTGEFRGRIVVTDGATLLPGAGSAGAFPLEIDSIQMLIDYDETPGDGGVYRVEATDSATKAMVSHSFLLTILDEGVSLPVAGMVGLGVLAGSIALAGVLLRKRR